MSVQECKDWIDFSENAGYEDAKINMGNRQVLNKSVRNNERFIYDSDKLGIELWKRIQPFVPPETAYGIACGLNE